MQQYVPRIHQLHKVDDNHCEMSYFQSTRGPKSHFQSLYLAVLGGSTSDFSHFSTFPLLTCILLHQASCLSEIVHFRSPVLHNLNFPSPQRLLAHQKYIAHALQVPCNLKRTVKGKTDRRVRFSWLPWCTYFSQVEIEHPLLSKEDEIDCTKTPCTRL